MRTLKKVFASFFPATLLLLPFYVLANPVLDAANRNQGLTQDDILNALGKVIDSFIVLVGIIAVASMMWSAFLFITAGGSEQQLAKAKKVLIWSIVGVAVAIFSFAVVTIVDTALTG